MNKSDFYWNVIKILTNNSGDRLVSAFIYVLYALNARGGVLWSCEKPPRPVFSTVTKPDNAYISRVDGGKTEYFDNGIICVPVLYNGRMEYCLQLQGASDVELTGDAALLFEKYLKENHVDVKAPERGKPIISVRDIEKSFSASDARVRVLNKISFDIYENEFLVILGASGTGKTTLLNIVGGLETADSGVIDVNGMNLVAASAKELNDFRRNEVGFVFQFYSLIPNLTAEENLRYISDIIPCKMTPGEALEKVGLSKVKHHFPSQLSSGQQQRVAIARALIKSPRIILADEPTGALDLSTSRDVLIVMEQITSSKQGTIVLITHNPEICRIADRVIVMRQGQIESITVNTRKQSASSLKW